MEGEPTYDAAMNHAEAFSLEESYDAFPRIEAEFEGALDASLGPRGPELLYELVQGLHLAPRANVLDVGCGEGRHSLALAERFGFSVHGVDPIPRHIELSKERLGYVARFGRRGYEIELGDCLWHVFHMIGKLTDRAYLLSKQP